MAREFTVDVDGAEYIGTTANAKNQLEALHLCMKTAYVTFLEEGKDYSDMGVVGAFVNMPFDQVQKLEKLLVSGNVLRRDDEVPVAPNLFVDDIHNYYLLIHRVLRENLGGFWKLQRPTNAKSVEQTQR